ncbi:hypothetical protein VTH06DRAFT_4410 [Thermothelomyces fergusii]
MGVQSGSPSDLDIAPRSPVFHFVFLFFALHTLIPCYNLLRDRLSWFWYCFSLLPFFFVPAKLLESCEVGSTNHLPSREATRSRSAGRGSDFQSFFSG